MGTSCSTAHITQKLTPGTHYKRDMILEVDGYQGEGLLVVPEKPVHKFHVEARGELDLFTLTTCHREWTKEKAWNVKKKSGLFGWGRKIMKREVEFPLSLNPLERSDYCLTELGGYEKDKGRHSWAMVDYQPSDLSKFLPAFVQCNGSGRNYSGVSMCQSRKGLIQSIEFTEDMLVDPDPECRGPKGQGRKFEFQLPEGKCVYLFVEKSEPHREHRLTTFGYEQILIRED